MSGAARTGRRSRRIAAAMACLVASAAAAPMGPPPPAPHCLPGRYDGSQPEVAAMLELSPDQRFRYMLSYGALDEAAEGRWAVESGGVSLTSDSMTPPRFARTGALAASEGRLEFQLDVPRGISRQYFSAIVRFADGRSVVREFQEDGLSIALAADARPVSVTLLLAVMDLESEAFPLDPGTGARFRFDPNDLGKVAFAATPLRFDGEDLLLERHGRSLRFRPSSEGCEVRRP